MVDETILPSWFIGDECKWSADVDGQRWVSNGHVLLAVRPKVERRAEPNASTPAYMQRSLDFAQATVTAKMRAALSERPPFRVEPSAPFLRKRLLGWAMWHFAVQLGAGIFQAPIIAMIEALYPGLVWYSDGTVAHAVLGDGTVAVVLGLEEKREPWEPPVSEPEI